MSNGLIGEDKLAEYGRLALDSSHASQTQVSVTGGDESLTRFANSTIHQNVAERNYELSVKVAAGRRLGYASTNQLSEDAIRQTVATAVRFAENQPENPDFVSLPHPSEAYPACGTYFPATADYGPDRRAGAVQQVVRQAADIGGTASGSLSISATEKLILNSLGVRAYADYTSASLVVVCQTADGVSYAEAHSRDVWALDVEAVAREAAERCKQNRNPADIAPGEYDVVLLPYAVAELLGMLAWVGLGALNVQEDRSFMSGHIGEKIMSGHVSIWDDGADPRGFARPFDGEGVAKQRTELITDGVAKGVVYDSYTAHKEGKLSTGHGSGGPVNWGPSPANLFLRSGSASVDDMIGGIDHGLLVTRFHYINVLKEKQALLTGMTRDGTFLIEGGQIRNPVKNLRFTESMLRAFSRVDAVGSHLKVSPHVCAPGLRIRGFRFTGVTEF